MVDTIAAVAGSVVAVLGIFWGVLRSVYKRGRNEEAIASSIDRQVEATAGNTEATKELAAQVGGLRVTLESHSQVLTEHHYRIKALEDRT